MVQNAGSDPKNRQNKRRERLEIAAILSFLAMCFMVLKGFVYTIVVDIYAFRSALNGI